MPLSIQFSVLNGNLKTKTTQDYGDSDVELKLNKRKYGMRKWEDDQGSWSYGSI